MKVSDLIGHLARKNPNLAVVIRKGGLFLPVDGFMDESGHLEICASEIREDYAGCKPIDPCPTCGADVVNVYAAEDPNQLSFPSLEDIVAEHDRDEIRTLATTLYFCKQGGSTQFKEIIAGYGVRNVEHLNAAQAKELLVELRNTANANAIQNA